MKVLQFPLTKITFWFIAGILFAFYAKPGDIPVFVWLGTTFLAMAVAWYFSKKQLRQQTYFGFAVYLFAFAGGAATLIVHSGYCDSDNYIHRLSGKDRQVLEVVLRERPKATAYNRYVALVFRVDGKPASGKILVNLNHDDFKENLPIGTNLKITGNIIAHKPPKNPDQFDYGKYLANKSILAQVYANADQVQVGQKLTKDIFYYSDKIRNTIIGNLKKSGFRQEELAVIAALILGQQQDISAEIIQDYQFAGAVHILSVSGLHVGFIVMFLNFALGFLPKNKMLSYLKLATIVVSLWGFAVLAGLSPSVVRSVTMFSFLAVGMHLKRKTNVFHTLLVSMLLILLFEPSFLFDVGFQLSYLALFSILWLQPIFADWWQPQNTILQYFWQILTVSFAAQIGTFPLSVYYFHQFPGLFFVTNLIVIPMLTVIMALGIAAMAPAVFGTVPIVLLRPLEWCIMWLNAIIARIASFEEFVIADLVLNRWMMLALYLCIIAWASWLDKPDFKKAVLALCTVAVFQCSTFVSQWHEATQREWIVFHVHKSTLVAERNGAQITVFGNKKIKDNKMLQTYATAHFSKTVRQQKLQNIAYFKHTKILVIDTLNVYPKEITPDIVLIRQSPKLNLERLLQTTRPKTVVADASNFKSYVRLWKATCEKYKIPFHATGEMGYYKL